MPLVWTPVAWLREFTSRHTSLPISLQKQLNACVWPIYINTGHKHCFEMGRIVAVVCFSKFSKLCDISAENLLSLLRLKCLSFPGSREFAQLTGILPSPRCSTAFTGCWSHDSSYSHHNGFPNYISEHQHYRFSSLFLYLFIVLFLCLSYVLERYIISYTYKHVHVSTHVYMGAFCHGALAQHKK